MSHPYSHLGRRSCNVSTLGCKIKQVLRCCSWINSPGIYPVPVCQAVRGTGGTAVSKTDKLLALALVINQIRFVTRGRTKQAQRDRCPHPTCTEKRLDKTQQNSNSGHPGWRDVWTLGNLHQKDTSQGYDRYVNFTSMTIKTVKALDTDADGEIDGTGKNLRWRVFLGGYSGSVSKSRINKGTICFHTWS